MNRSLTSFHNSRVGSQETLSNSVGDVDRSYIVAQTNYNRRVAAAQQMSAVQASFEADTASLLDLVESQRRLADAVGHPTTIAHRYGQRVTATNTNR